MLNKKFSTFIFFLALVVAVIFVAVQPWGVHPVSIDGQADAEVQSEKILTLDSPQSSNNADPTSELPSKSLNEKVRTTSLQQAPELKPVTTMAVNSPVALFPSQASPKQQEVPEE